MSDDTHSEVPAPIPPVGRYKVIIGPYSGYIGACRLIDTRTGETILVDSRMRVQVTFGPQTFTTATITIPVELEADVITLRAIVMEHDDAK